MGSGLANGTAKDHDNDGDFVVASRFLTEAASLNIHVYGKFPVIFKAGRGKLLEFDLNLAADLGTGNTLRYIGSRYRRLD